MGKITIYVVKHVFNIFVALQKEYEDSKSKCKNFNYGIDISSLLS